MYAALKSVIVIIVLIVAVIAQKADKNKSNRKNLQGGMQNTYKGNGMQRQQKSAQGNRMAGGQSYTPAPQQKNTANRKAGNKNTGSTTEYLKKKAMEDQREHAVEKREEQRRMNMKYGNVSTAARHVLGDPIPQGMKVVCCGYCGAENEVKTGYHGGLCCYFCRTKL